MAVLTLDEIKTHLRLELDDASRDDELLRLEAQALDYASRYVGRPIPWTDEAGAEVDVPASVKGAMLLLIGEFDQVREASVVGTIYSRTAMMDSLLHFYRVGMGI